MAPTIRDPREPAGIASVVDALAGTLAALDDGIAAARAVRDQTFAVKRTTLEGREIATLLEAELAPARARLDAVLVELCAHRRMIAGAHRAATALEHRELHDFRRDLAILRARMAPYRRLDGAAPRPAPAPRPAIEADRRPVARPLAPAGGWTGVPVEPEPQVAPTSPFAFLLRGRSATNRADVAAEIAPSRFARIFYSSPGDIGDPSQPPEVGPDDDAPTAAAGTDMSAPEAVDRDGTGVENGAAVEGDAAAEERATAEDAAAAIEDGATALDDIAAEDDAAAAIAAQPADEVAQPDDEDHGGDGDADGGTPTADAELTAPAGDGGDEAEPASLGVREAQVVAAVEGTAAGQGQDRTRRRLRQRAGVILGLVLLVLALSTHGASLGTVAGSTHGLSGTPPPQATPDLATVAAVQSGDDIGTNGVAIANPGGTLGSTTITGTAAGNGGATRSPDEERAGRSSLVAAQSPIVAHVYYRVTTSRPQIALTFDDGYNASALRQIVSILEQQHVPATFFVNGMYLSRAPEVWQQIAADGFVVGSHTYHHTDVRTMTEAEIATDLARTNAAWEAITGAPLAALFRPPYGAHTAATDLAVARAGYPTIVLWNTTAGDTAANPTRAQLIANATRGTNGSIVLMHAGPAITPTVLPDIIAAYLARGFEFVTVPELISAAGS